MFVDVAQTFSRETNRSSRVVDYAPRSLSHGTNLNIGLCRFFRRFSGQVLGDLTELFESGFEVFDDFLGENVSTGKVVGCFPA
jgi:hypothetical protein